MEDQEIQASRFKEQCLALLDRVARTRVPLVVTKHGKRVARVVPLDEDGGRTVLGSVRFLVENDEELFSTDESWHAERPSLDT